MPSRVAGLCTQGKTSRGAPARVVSPFDLAYKSIKFVHRVEFTEAPLEGWWTRANPIDPVEAPAQEDRLRTPDPRRRQGRRTPQRINIRYNTGG
ncbi:MAG: hypothetical protein RDU24_04945 [Humidesulfovibrio sp.]|uniref:hypothetical protein n=1 Tax=Humidesulfovibrio sp. TaxID=2910988 RepID=UPI0027F16C56|nr:hypothetical protein [Humidesulfovibrio sp.]MDQ7834708.1 hypothetical protein [Humidesulfovibrio sp.]